MIRMKTKILYPELSYQITGLCFRAQRELGRFCRERQYGDQLEVLFKEERIPYKREYEVFCGNKVDFLIADLVIFDAKAKKFLTKEDYNQMQRYSQSSNRELGLIVNFRSVYLKPKRILNTKIYSENSDKNTDFSDRK